MCISHTIVFVTHKEEFSEELESKLKSKRNCDYFVFGFVNFENKHENSKSVIIVWAWLYWGCEPKGAGNIIGAYLSGLHCVMIKLWKS